MSDAKSNARKRGPRVDPVPLFFGPTGPGPFALLGLPPVEVETPRVFEALHLRLAQLTRHPQSATPAGEEVNLALHAAAAQLSDPAVRRVLLRAWGEGSQSSAPVSSEFTRIGEPGGSAIDDDIERELHLAVGLSGGWNARSMERLALACRLKGVELEDALRAVQWVARARPRWRATVGAPAKQGRRANARVRSDLHEPSAGPAPASPSRPIPRDAVILVGIGGLGILFFVTAIILLTPAKRPALPIDAPTSGSIVSVPLNIGSPDSTRPPDRASPVPSGDLDAGDPRAITHEIAGATQDLASDAGGAHARFARAYDAFGSTWPLMSADEVSAVVSAIVDFCYGASRLETPTAATITRPLREPIGSGKSAVRAAAAAASIAGRLLSERELPRAFLDQLEVGATIGVNGPRVESSPAFRVGLERNLNSLASAIATSAPGSVESWMGFVEVIDSAMAARQPARDVATLNALELVLRSTTVPPRDLVRSVGVLAPALSWRPSDELSGALAAWLEDATVPSELMTEITRAMVASSAPGVDSTMVLPAGSGPDARSNLRERLAQAWQGKTVTTEREDFAAWTRWAETLLYTEATTDAERLWNAARLSNAILASDALRSGKPERAGEIMATDASTPLAPASVTLPTQPKPEAGSKALDYAAAGASVQARLEILRQVQSSAVRPDTLLAEMLVTEASRGSPAAIRDLARAEVREHAAEPSVVLATLRLLSSIPETPENADWLAEVANAPNKWTKRTKWKDAAQIALLDRAIALFPVSTTEAALDASAGELARSWLDRAGDENPAAQSDPGSAIEILESRLGTATRSMRGAPAGLNAVDIRRRLTARSDIAPGPLEAAVARQGACVEWTALNVAQERPADIGAVQQLLEQWNAARRTAGSSTEQLLEGEKAMLRLELLRLGRKAGAS